MCAQNFTKFRFPLAGKASFHPVYLELPLESPINMSINRNIIIFYSELTSHTIPAYNPKHPRFVPLVAMLTKIKIQILTTDNHQYTF